MYHFLSVFLGRLRLPWLFALSALGLLLNIFIPDPVPFLDEVLLALLTGILAAIRKPKRDKQAD